MWNCSEFRPEDLAFLNDSHIFPILRRVMAPPVVVKVAPKAYSSPAVEDEKHPLEQSEPMLVLPPIDPHTASCVTVTTWPELPTVGVKVVASSNTKQANMVINGNTTMFWDSAGDGMGEGRKSEHTLLFTWPEHHRVSQCCVYLDKDNDTDARIPKQFAVSGGASEIALASGCALGKHDSIPSRAEFLSLSILHDSPALSRDLVRNFGGYALQVRVCLWCARVDKVGVGLRFSLMSIPDTCAVCERV